MRDGDLTASTVTGNSADSGGGVFSVEPYYYGETRIRSSIVAANGIDDCAVDEFAEGEGRLVSEGGNVFGPGGCGEATLEPTDIAAADPLLGPLADNGGPTPTHALLEGSPALGRALPGGPRTDQRGRSRLGDPDSGSFERQP